MSKPAGGNRFTRRGTVPVAPDFAEQFRRESVFRGHQRFVPLASQPVLPYPEGMEVHFTPEQEAELARLAHHAGKSSAVELLKDAALWLLDEEARFRAAVMEAKACARRGEFIEGEEMDARFEEMLRC